MHWYRVRNACKLAISPILHAFSLAVRFLYIIWNSRWFSYLNLLVLIKRGHNQAVQLAVWPLEDTKKRLNPKYVMSMIYQPRSPCSWNKQCLWYHLNNCFISTIGESWPPLFHTIHIVKIKPCNFNAAVLT